MEGRERIEKIYEIAEWKPFQRVLYHLGVNWNYEGFGLVIETAIRMRRSEGFDGCMKGIYIDVGRGNRTSPNNVERDITTIIQVIWRAGNRELLEKMAGRELTKAPTCREFLRMLVNEIDKRESK